MWGQSNSASGRGVLGLAGAGSGITTGVFGQSNSTSGIGVHGEAIANSGFNYGGRFESASTSGRGVYSWATASSGSTYGVLGRSDSTSGRGVYGLANAASGTTYGVWGESDSTSGRGVLGLAATVSGTNYGVLGQSNSTSGFDFYASGAGTNYGSASSIRWKSNVGPIDQPLEKIARLRGVYFDWDAEHGGHHDVGMIAEEVGAVLPEIVQYEENGTDAIGMDYSKLTPLLVEAVKEMHRASKQKDAEITELTQRLERMEAMMARVAENKTRGDQ